MNHTKKVGERLDEILYRFHNKYVNIPGHSNTQVYDEAHTAILALFKSIMPEEKTYKDDWGGQDLEDHKEEAMVYGFNQCRTELLKLLDEA